MGTRWLWKHCESTKLTITFEFKSHRIKDERFICFIWKALRAGYLDFFPIPKYCLAYLKDQSYRLPHTV